MTTEQNEAVTDIKKIAAEMRELEDRVRAKVSSATVSRWADALDALATQSEPVMWWHGNPDHVFPQRGCDDCQPLYAAPQPAPPQSQEPVTWFRWTDMDGYERITSGRPSVEHVHPDSAVVPFTPQPALPQPQGPVGQRVSPNLIQALLSDDQILEMARARNLLIAPPPLSESVVPQVCKWTPQPAPTQPAVPEEFERALDEFSEAFQAADRQATRAEVLRLYALAQQREADERALKESALSLLERAQALAGAAVKVSRDALAKALKDSAEGPVGIDGYCVSEVHRALGKLGIEVTTP